MQHEADANVEPQAKRGVVLAGRYQLTRALDTGGMSSVWLAHDTSLDVDVAVKLVRLPRRSQDKEFARELAVRLVHEARVAAQVRHPAIVSVIDVAETDWGQPFVVMELLVGEHLATVLHRDGPLKAIKAVRLMLPVVQGMSLAHEKGIVHRDLKPANIFLARGDDGRIQPKVIDFGIAKSNRLDRMNLTKQGETMGSPAYMSPEQVRGEDADARSDVWGICMTLYELVTGKLPFERPSDVASMLAIVETEAPTLASLGFDETLSTIVEHGMKKDPGERWQSLSVLGSELNRFLQGHGVNEDGAGQVIVAPPAADGGSERPLSIPGVQPRRREVGLAVVFGVGMASLLTIALALRASFENPGELAPIEAPTLASSAPEPAPEPVAVPPPPAATPAPAPTPTPAPTPSARPVVTVKKPTPAPPPAPPPVIDTGATSEPMEPLEPAPSSPSEAPSVP